MSYDPERKGASVPILLAAGGVLAVFAVASYGSLAQDSCRDTMGEEGAQVYVAQCLEVTGATHPPCNVENSCEIMVRHITENCTAWSREIDEIGLPMPEFCDAYLSQHK